MVMLHLNFPRKFRVCFETSKTVGVQEKMNLEWRRSFVSKVFGLENEKDIVNAEKLIRLHAQNLSQAGDFSCPGKSEIWSRVLKNVEVEHSSLEKIDSLKNELALSEIKLCHKNGYLSFWLNRSAFITNVLESFEKIDFKLKKEQTCDLQNLDLFYRSSRCELTSIRCNQLTQFVERLLRCGLVNSSNFEEISITSNDKIRNAILVGPVIDKKTKKKCADSFLNVYKRFLSILDIASKERLVQSEDKRIANVHAVTSAEIQFQLLSNNLSQPAIIDENADKAATFVLYNHARIVQLLQATKEENRDKTEIIDFNLLNEEDEWEMIFVYLSRYLFVLNDILKPGDVKVGRLLQYLTGLSQSFSRYYNRVHVIKDAAHLWPTQCSRLKLVSIVKSVMEHALELLTIPCLGRM